LDRRKDGEYSWVSKARRESSPVYRRLDVKVHLAKKRLEGKVLL
jgi:hypothetical protein